MTRVRGWFDGWIEWEKHHAHGRHLAVGLGAYRNVPADTLAQAARVRQVNRGGRVVGLSFFSYAVPALPAAVKPGTDLPSVPVTGSDRLAFLSERSAGSQAVFAHPAAVPAMPWIVAPETGWIAGTVDAATPSDNDGIVVTVKRKRFWPFGNTTRVRTDGNGYFGLTGVKPGQYEVRVGKNARTVRVVPGTGRAGGFPVRSMTG